jgi:hypothetical protein
MFSEVLRNSAAQIVWSDRQLSPFRPPYLVIPVRLFVMNRSSFPQNISDIWVSFDEGSFEKMRFVTLSRITETNGSQVIWPKTVPPWGSIGLDLTVSIPIDEEVAKLIGADPGRRKTVNLGSVEKLFFTISSHKLKEVEWKKIKTRTTFDLRLLSPSPGGPTNLPYSVELP